MKRMLINATQPEELRVAVADGQVLIDLDIEVPSQEQKKSNVYKGRITRVEPSLEACFVDFGSTRHGFLPFKEICKEAYHPSAKKKDGRLSIRDAVKEGQEVIVQVEKEERGNKGAALTTYLSLAGRYLVLMPTNPKAGGVSRRISGEDRQDLREQLQQVIAPDNVGIIVRTAGVGREAEELQWDLDYLLQVWTAIEKAAVENSAPFLIYQESNLMIRALRDHLRNDIGEILIDNQKVFDDAREFVQQVMPHNSRKLKQYTDSVPLFNRFQIESQIESAFARTVHLPSGGSVVIDHTEALLSIDINSARSTKGSDIEETAYQTNLEAADEIARQLRLRDLGGLIVIDFIDMMERKHQRAVEERLRHALQIDKARVQTGRISRFGLLEMSRQRLRPSLGESSQEPCPRCDGHGHIRSVESLALSIMRLVEEESMKDYTGQVFVQAPTTVANFLLNEKRKALSEIEARHSVPIMILSNEHMDRPKFEIHRLRKSEVTDEPSYTQIEQPTAELVANQDTQAASTGAAPVAAVTGVMPSRPAPVREKKAKPGFFGQLFSRLFSGSEEEEVPAKKPSRKKASRKPQGGKKKTSRSRQPQQRGRQGGDSRSRNPRRGGKKKTGKPGQAQQGQAQQGQRKSDSRRGKKTQRKKTPRRGKPQNAEQTRNQQQSAGGKQEQTQQQRQSGGPRQDQSQKQAEDRQQSTDKKPIASQQATSRPQDKPVTGSKPDTGAASSAEGSTRNVESKQTADQVAAPKTDSKPESASRKPRRRRSPYQTAGAKNRDSRSEESNVKAVKKASDDNKPVKKASDDNKPVKKTADDSKPGNKAVKDSKPAKKATEKTQPELALPKSGDVKSGGPVVNVTKDAKGIYTLKPSGSEKAAKPARSDKAPKAEKAKKAGDSDKAPKSGKAMKAETPKQTPKPEKTG